jgi:hypothetical protein
MNRNSIYIKVILDSIRKANLNHPEGEKSLIIDSLIIKNINTFNNIQSELSLSQSTKLSYIGITFNNSYLTMNMFINAEKPKPVESKDAGYIEYIFTSLTPSTSLIVPEHSMTIKIKEADKKVFERYVFPAPEGSYLAKLESDAPLSREEANEIRDEYIEKIQDPEKKKEAYFLLQEKVTLIDPVNFKGIDTATKQCISACDTIMKRHYEELGKTYRTPFESWSLATQDSVSIYIHKECYDRAMIYLDNELGNGNPVMVGVDYKSGNPGNYDNITDHWVVITARRHDERGVYYTYLEVANRPSKTTKEDFNRGTSTNRNRFYLDINGAYLIGIESTVNKNKDKPIVTIIRGETDKANKDCCGRTQYINDKSKGEKPNANRIDKKNANGTFFVIRNDKLDYNIK